MESNFQSPVSESAKKPRYPLVFLIGAFLLLLILVYVMSVSFGEKGGRFTEEKVEVVKTDLALAQGNEKIPSGFPSDIPVETDGITESYVMDYKDRGVVQYTVSFTTNLSEEEAFQKYQQVLESIGFETEIAGGGANTTAIAGSRGGNDVSVVINTSAGVNTVQISYLDRS